ncbi:hypothetical protein RHSIM_Rhsim11G0031300 [Rhododendron simsii]|uniref:Asp_protease_2 domain-containing protein n=1 Tax=Rhododendron simsii TaxID=118357 RepID=A0A834G4E5_RHOSS|nr:hypothetical protein RHSIM_Rhsim11G0031300 [Rhododendron simsii]
MDVEGVVTDQSEPYEKEAVYDDDHQLILHEEVIEEVVGDVRPLLVVCRFVIDSGSCKNVVAEEAVQKLGLKTGPHPNPYKLSWLKRGNEVKVSKKILVAFSVGSKYRDEIWCDVVAMDACHLLLGQPWQYDRRVTLDGGTNTYTLSYGGTKISLLPSKEVGPKPREGTNLLS